MKTFIFILQLILLVQIYSSLLEKFDQKLIEAEGAKCEQIKFKDDNINVDECVKISSSLQLTGINEGQCCKISVSMDTLLQYKLRFGEDWKKRAIEYFKLDENITEEELRNKYFLPEDNNFCGLMIKIVGNLQLYQLSSLSVDGSAKFDCGEGEKIFKSKEYYPTDKDEIFDKDMIDCQLEFSEKNCNKRGIRLSSDNAQCCWCEKIALSQDEFLSDNYKECTGCRISDFKEILTKALNSAKERNSKFEYKCECYNNIGKTIKGSYNTVTGEVLVE